MSGPETRAPRLGALSLRARASLAVIAVFFCAAVWGEVSAARYRLPNVGAVVRWLMAPIAEPGLAGISATHAPATSLDSPLRVATAPQNAPAPPRMSPPPIPNVTTLLPASPSTSGSSISAALSRAVVTSVNVPIRVSANSFCAKA